MNVLLTSLLAAFLSLAIGSSALAEMTVSEFVDLYKRASPVARQDYEDMASKTENGMSWFRTMSKIDLYCEPKNLALTGHQLMDILRREVRGANWSRGPLGVLVCFTP
jgi:hypothetical protein